MNNKFPEGLGVALVTPFKVNKSIDFEALSLLIDFQIDNGVDYMVALGTTAETPALFDKEKAEVVAAVVKQVAGRVPVVVGMGGNNTAQVVKALEGFEQAGVSAFLSVTPYYNKPNQEGLYQHYMALSAASPLPIILYNVPGRTGVNMTAETTLRIARACPNVIGIKEASGNLDQIKAIIENSPEGFRVISGDDSLTAAVVAAGGVGVISVFGNAFPKQMSRLVNNALAGNAEAAMGDERAFGRLFHLLFADGSPAGVKYMLHRMGRLANEVRLPLVPVNEGTAREIDEAMSAAFGH